MGMRGATRAESSWSNRSGEVVTYRAGDPKPDLPPGRLAKRPKPEASPAPEPTGPPVSDEQGLANIKRMSRLYRQDPGGTNERNGT